MEKARILRKALYYQESQEEGPTAQAYEEDPQNSGW